MRRIAPVVNLEQIESNAYHAGRADERLETREMMATVAATAAAAAVVVPKTVVAGHRRLRSAPVPQIVHAARGLEAPSPPGVRRLRMVGEFEEEEDSDDEDDGWSDSAADDSSVEYGVVPRREKTVYLRAPVARRSGAVLMEERVGGRVRMVRGPDVQQAMRTEQRKGEKEVVYVRAVQDETRGRLSLSQHPLRGGKRSFERRSPVDENHDSVPFGGKNPFAPRPGLAERR